MWYNFVHIFKGPNKTSLRNILDLNPNLVSNIFFEITSIYIVTVYPNFIDKTLYTLIPQKLGSLQTSKPCST